MRQKYATKDTKQQHYPLVPALFVINCTCKEVAIPVAEHKMYCAF